MNENEKTRRRPMPAMPDIGVNTILLIALLVLCVILLITLFGTKKLMKEQYVVYETEIQTLQSEIASLRQTTQSLSDELASGAYSASSTQSATTTTDTIPVYDTTSGEVTITKQPMSVETTVGRSEALFLSVEAQATNSSITFTWQKLNESTNTWETIDFEYPGYNYELGLRLYDNSVNGETQLWANGLTAEAFGVYRCIASDARNNQAISETVSATVKAE